MRPFQFKDRLSVPMGTQQENHAESVSLEKWDSRQPGTRSPVSLPPLHPNTGAGPSLRV